MIQWCVNVKLTMKPQQNQQIFHQKTIQTNIPAHSRQSLSKTKNNLQHGFESSHPDVTEADARGDEKGIPKRQSRGKLKKNTNTKYVRCGTGQDQNIKGADKTGGFSKWFMELVRKWNGLKTVDFSSDEKGKKKCKHIVGQTKNEPSLDSISIGVFTNA